MKKILVIEDDDSIRDELVELLENANYEALVLNDFKHSLDEILKISPDLILLDINIPYMNGEMLLKELREISSIPVIMVTSRNTEVDEVLSISYGADDYITKPYNPTILLLRINNIFKRLEHNSDVITYKDLTVNIKKSIILKDDKEILLTKNEMIIFSYLLANKNRIVTRDELMTDLWNNSEYINDNALTVREFSKIKLTI